MMKKESSQKGNNTKEIKNENIQNKVTVPKTAPDSQLEKKIQSVKIQPVKSQPVKSQPVKSMPAKSQPANTQPANTQQAKTANSNLKKNVLSNDVTTGSVVKNLQSGGDKDEQQISLNVNNKKIQYVKSSLKGTNPNSFSNKGYSRDSKLYLNNPFQKNENEGKKFRKNFNHGDKQENVISELKKKLKEIEEKFAEERAANEKFAEERAANEKKLADDKAKMADMEKTIEVLKKSQEEADKVAQNLLYKK
jgi:hypothetical protein